MIYFILAGSNSNTIKKYLEYRGNQLQKDIGIIYYDDLSKLNGLECNTLIFSDFDRLNKNQLAEVIKIFDIIKSRYPELNLVNNPAKTKLRFDLLRELYNLGINPFNVHRIVESLNNIRFPVFLREENNHTGALSGLIFNYKSLEANVFALSLQGYPAKNLLAVEFVDVADEMGIYGKYSALKVVDTVYPRQLDYNMHWMVKTSIRYNRYPEKEFLKEFKYFMDNNPHEIWLEKVFKLAGIEYGRIDYGLLNNQPVVWEINLNPDYGGRKRKKRKKRNVVIQEIRNTFHTTLIEKWKELNRNNLVKLQLDLPPSTLQIMQPDYYSENWRKFHNRLNTKKPAFKIIIKLVRNCLVIFSFFLLFVLSPFNFRVLKKEQ